MPAVAMTKPPQTAARKDLYDIGEIPPRGHVPAQMHAWAIRKDRHGPPETSMQLEVLPTWPIGENEVLVLVMAGGVNYNGVWAGLGIPISPLDVHRIRSTSPALTPPASSGPAARKFVVGRRATR